METLSDNGEAWEKGSQVWARESQNVARKRGQGGRPRSLLTYGVGRGGQDMHLARKKSQTDPIH